MGQSSGGNLKARLASWIGLALVFATVPAAPAMAADVTDVVDAADGDDPFDFHLEPRFSQTIKRSLIRREYPCNPSATQDDIDRKSVV